jgi:hypothetical protein
MWLMSGDTILTLINQILGLAVIAIGIVITLYPLTQNKRKVACLSLFVAIGIAVIVTSTIQSDRASKALNDQLDKVRRENRDEYGELHARLDAVVAAVKSSPPNVNIRDLSDRVTKLAAPQPPTGLRATVY